MRQPLFANHQTAMCGAFSVTHPFKELGRTFNAGYEPADFPLRYNARPGQKLPVILNEQPRKVVLGRWGLAPSWKGGSMVINARKESLNAKMFFYEPFHRRRCLVPADGFYEWATVGGRKIPYRFVLKTGEVFAFAGVWQQGREAGQSEFAIITVEPNGLVKKVHDRMPAILPPRQALEWINPQAGPQQALDLLEPYPAQLMEAYRVSSLLNSARNDFLELIRPAGPNPGAK